MGLISAIRSALGLDTPRDEPGGTEVTMEHGADARSERAVKESDAAATGGADAAADETGTASEEPASGETDQTAGAEPEEGEPVEEIKGIGPAYADRLAEAGVHSVADLADADAADLGEATGIGESRIQNWIDRARAR